MSFRRPKHARSAEFGTGLARRYLGYSGRETLIFWSRRPGDFHSSSLSLQSMRRLLTTISVLVLASVAAWAVQVTVQSFTARSTGTSIIVEWKSAAEPDVTTYELERAGDDQVFRHVSTVTAKGSNQPYSYTDDEAFGKRDGADGSVTRNYFTYRLKIVRSDKSFVYSNTIGINHSVSGIKKTWGMIKEMFR